MSNMLLNLNASDVGTKLRVLSWYSTVNDHELACARVPYARQRAHCQSDSTMIQATARNCVPSKGNNQVIG